MYLDIINASITANSFFLSMLLYKKYDFNFCTILISKVEICYDILSLL